MKPELKTFLILLSAVTAMGVLVGCIPESQYEWQREEMKDNCDFYTWDYSNGLTSCYKDGETIIGTYDCNGKKCYRDSSGNEFLIIEDQRILLVDSFPIIGRPGDILAKDGIAYYWNASDWIPFKNQ